LSMSPGWVLMQSRQRRWQSRDFAPILGSEVTRSRQPVVRPPGDADRTSPDSGDESVRSTCVIAVRGAEGAREGGLFHADAPAHRWQWRQDAREDAQDAAVGDPNPDDGEEQARVGGVPDEPVRTTRE